MVNFTILAGGFSAFIATYVFDSDAGTLNLTKQTRTGQNPSWIASHQLNSSILYAVNEIGPVGALQSFTVDADGVPSLVDSIPTSGNSPTFTHPLLTGEVTGINFGSPNASFIATDPDDPTRFLPQNSSVVRFPVNGGPSNPHMSLEYNDEVLIADFGADKIWRVGRDGVDGSFKVQGEIRYPPGNGPRHLAIRNDILFVLHEKTSVLTAQAIPQAPNGTALPILANVSIVPEEATRLNGSFFAAEILVSEPSEKFPEPLIYVSNRNLGPQFDERGDTIAIFEYSALRTGGGVNSSTTILAESVPLSTTTSQPSTSTASGAPSLNVFTTLIPAPAKRMVRSHAHRRAAYEEARRQYDYGGYGGASEPSSSAPAASGPPVITLTTNPVVAAASATVPASASATVAGPVMASSTPTAVALRLVNQVHTGLRQIRSFTIGKLGTDGEEFLIAGANTEGGVAVFQRTDGGRNLTLVARNTELQNRTSFVFL